MTELPKAPQGPTRRQISGARFKAGLHIVMGIIYLILGVSVFYVKQFGSMDLDPIIAYLLSGLFALYGVFRIWRGFTDYRHMRSGIE